MTTCIMTSQIHIIGGLYSERVFFDIFLSHNLQPCACTGALSLTCIDTYLSTSLFGFRIRRESFWSSLSEVGCRKIMSFSY